MLRIITSGTWAWVSEAADAGHFEICSDPRQLKRLIQHLGFEIERDFEDSDRPETNWGCVAVKRT